MGSGILDRRNAGTRWMKMAYSVSEFTYQFDRLIYAHGDQLAELVKQGAPLIEHLLENRRSLSGILAHRREKEGYRARHLLHRHPAGAYTLWMMVFPAGRCTPVHDHGTWGLIGVWKGEEHEDKYERNGPPHIMSPLLTKTGETRNAPGAVTALLTPGRDIHSVRNPTDSPAYSIHIYGKASAPSHVFDLETGAQMTWHTHPAGIAKAWGYQPSLANLLGLRNVTSGELLNEIRRRLRDTADPNGQTYEAQ